MQLIRLFVHYHHIFLVAEKSSCCNGGRTNLSHQNALVLSVHGACRPRSSRQGFCPICSILFECLLLLGVVVDHFRLA